MQKLHFIELDSTNDYLKNNYESLINLTFVSADYQIKGRGRNERKWFSSKGENLLFSILIKENITLKEPGLYSIYCIVEIAKYLEKIGLKNVLIKWPNDIYVNDKKILGVLSEGKYLGSDLLYVIVGIGLNVNQQYLNEQLNRPFTSIYNELNHPIDIEILKDEIFPLLEKLLLNINDYQKETNSYLSNHNYLKNKEVYAFLNNEKKLIKVIDIVDGKLLAKVDNELILINSGEITFH